MSFSHDRRGQSVVVGTVILFGFLILAMATYQVQFVPMENEEIEFEHSQQVEGEFLDLRNAILQAGSTGSAQSKRIQLGTRYPQRTFFLNPPPASGTLETTDAREIRFENVTVEDGGNVEAYWANNDLTFNTSSMQYRPDYNEYRGAPRLTYEHSAIAAEFDNEAVLFRSEPTVLRKESGSEPRISLTLLSGDISANGVDAQNIDITPVSQGRGSVQIAPDSGVSRIVLPTTVENQTALVKRWNQTTDATVTKIPGEDQIQISLSGNHSLSLSEVAVDGSGTTEPAYIVPVTGNGTVDQSVGVEVRDKYNNPVSGAEVWFDDSKRVSGTDGRAFFEPADSGSLTVTINDSADPLDYETVPFTVAEAGGSSSVNRTFSTEFDLNPTTVVVNGNATVVANEILDLNVTVEDPYENRISNSTIDYSITPQSPNGSLRKWNQSVHDGTDNVTFEAGSAQEDEYFNVFASAGDDVDTLGVIVINGSVDLQNTISASGTEFTVDYGLVNLDSGYLVVENEDEAPGVNVSRSVTQGTSTAPVQVSDIGGISGGDTINATLYQDNTKRTQLATVTRTVTSSSNLGAFSTVSVTNMVENSNSESQTFTFSLDGDLAEGDEVVINLNDPQDGTGPPNSREIQYNGATVTVNSGTGTAAVNAGGPNAEVVYTAGSGGDSSGTQIQVTVDGVTTGGVAGEQYDVVFEQPSSGATTSTTFGIASTAGDRSVSGTVSGNLFSTGSLTVAQDGVIEGDVGANGDVTMNLRSEVDGTVISGGSMTVGQDAVVGGGIDAQGDVTMNLRSEVGGTVTSSGSMTVGQDAVVRGGIDTQGDVTMNLRSEVDGTVMSDGAVTLGQNSDIRGDVVAGGDVTVGQQATVEGSVTTDGQVSLGQSSTIGGDVFVDSAGDISCGQGSTINGQACSTYVDENY